VKGVPEGPTREDVRDQCVGHPHAHSTHTWRETRSRWTTCGDSESRNVKLTRARQKLHKRLLPLALRRLRGYPRRVGISYYAMGLRLLERCHTTTRPAACLLILEINARTMSFVGVKIDCELWIHKYTTNRQRRVFPPLHCVTSIGGGLTVLRHQSGAKFQTLCILAIIAG